MNETYHNKKELDLIESLRIAFKNELNLNELSYNKLSALLGNRNLLNSSLRNNSDFRSITIDNFERIADYILSDEENHSIAINALNDYRRMKGYSIQNEAHNIPEIKLIESLRNAFSDERGRVISNTELGEIFGYRKLITKALGNNSIFLRSTIDKIENIVKKSLSEKNKKIALEALIKYKEERELILEFSQEIELIGSLHNIFSKVLGKIISYRELSKILGNPNLISRVIRDKLKFLEKTLVRFEKIIREKLIGENRNEALKAIAEYRENQEPIWNEDFKKKQSEISKQRWKNENYRKKQAFAKSTEEWKQKQSDRTKKLWNNDNFIQKQKNIRSSKEYLAKKSRTMKKLFEDPIFKQKHKNAQLRGPDHPGWNTNRDEVMQPYGPEWYELKKEQIATLYQEQGGRDGLTGEKFTTDDILHRHHIYYDKGNYQIDQLILLKNPSHGKVQNPPHPNSKKWSDLFQKAKEFFAKGEPPEYWPDLYKELFRQEKRRQTELNEY